MAIEEKQETENILTSGREIDALVAEKILDLEAFSRNGGEIYYVPLGSSNVFIFNGENNYPRFSTSDSYAWRFVVPALQKRGWLVVVKAMANGFYFRSGEVEPITYTLPFCCELYWQPTTDLANIRRRIHGRQTAFGETMAEAVCRAGLLGVEAEKKIF
jgi:hypothetical protein